MTQSTVRTARRVIVGIAGTTVLIVGVAMLVLPGPGIVVIGVGLALLSLEFAFAHRWLRRVRERSSQAADQARIPKRYRWLFPAAGLLVSVVMIVVPGFFTIVRRDAGWLVLRNEHFSYAHAWTSVERLEHAAAKGDLAAQRLLQSIQLRNSTKRIEENNP